MKTEQNPNQDWIAIKCPHCGYEYVPAEIFLAEEIYGKPATVIRDALGKIIYVEWEDGYEPQAVETYCCDNCDKSFIVEANLSFKVKPQAEELDFSDTSASLLN